VTASPITSSDENFTAPYTATSPLNATFTYNNPGSTTAQSPLIIPQPSVTLLVPSPSSGGGVVGLSKVADNNSPLPRDRIIFNYDYFNNVPLTVNGVNVHRFEPGVEWTFFDRLTSIQVTLPFAATLSNDIQTNGLTSRDAELGDLHLVLKGLAYRSNTLYAGGGLAFDLPTAKDVNVIAPDGTTLIKVRNQAVLLTPYVAYLWAPNNNFFFQNWYQFVIDTNGNTVQANFPTFGLENVGRIHQQSLLQIDAQVGYWAYRSADSQALVNSVAPFLELHYNTTMNKAETVEAGSLAVGSTTPNFSELNLSAGFLALVNNNFLLQVGAAVPLLGQNNRSFDYQIGIRGSFFFGPTARNMTAAAAVSSF
jgi:hypothetical protein